MSDQEMNDCINDLNFFFKQATEDDQYNARLAQPYIRKCGSKFAFMSCASVADRMQKFPSFVSTDIVTVASISNALTVHSLFKAYGDQAASMALSGAISASDEDVRAVHAYILASNDLANPKCCSYLKDLLQNTVGTSCKIILAFALHKCGDSRELLYFFNKGYLCPKFMAKDLIELSMEDHPDKSREQVERIQLDWHATDGVPHVLGVFGLLVLDNWTKGRFASEGYLAGLPWTRKTYYD